MFSAGAGRPGRPQGPWRDARRPRPPPKATPDTLTASAPRFLAESIAWAVVTPYETAAEISRFAAPLCLAEISELRDCLPCGDTEASSNGQRRPSAAVGFRRCADQRIIGVRSTTRPPPLVCQAGTPTAHRSSDMSERTSDAAETIGGATPGPTSLAHFPPIASLSGGTDHNVRGRSGRSTRAHGW